MKIITIAGTRPELIRLSIIIKKLDYLIHDHIFVYTNQNYDYNLSGKFFDELNIRKPNYYFDKENYSIGGFLATAIIEFEKIINAEKPDKILILGDTNSGLLSLIAKKYNIPIYHMESGNRCFDERVPEEINRRLIDHLATYNLPYTDNSKQNLLTEGFHKNYVFKTGNPIYEVLEEYKVQIESSDVLDKLGLFNKYFVLVTAHRAENVDQQDSLYNIVQAMNIISERYPVVFSCHPRTKHKIKKFNINVSNNVIIEEPFGFFDFVKLEKNAGCVLTDSGTVQEECCIFGVPTITIRQSTERQETIECGSNVLSGVFVDDIIAVFRSMPSRGWEWLVPEDYLVANVSDIVINILLGR